MAEPLIILADARWTDHPQLKAYATKRGYLVQWYTLPVDVILHPNAHYWTDDFWETGMLETVMKHARAAKKGATNVDG